MKGRIVLLVMCLLLSVPSVTIAKSKPEQESAAPATSSTLPPGLQKKGKVPPGLEKQGKTPRGWSRGKARWKQPAAAPSANTATPTTPGLDKKHKTHPHRGHGRAKRGH